MGRSMANRSRRAASAPADPGEIDVPPYVYRVLRKEESLHDMRQASWEKLRGLGNKILSRLIIEHFRQWQQRARRLVQYVVDDDKLHESKVAGV